MTGTLTRPWYLDGGLLSAEDYANAQAYQAEIQTLRDREPHLWGIADGLDVVGVPGRRAVSVSTGMAVDVMGRQIVLTRVTTFDLANAGVPLNGWLTLRASIDYTAWGAFTGTGGYTRRVQSAVLAFTGTRPEDGESIPLARLVIAPDGRLQPPDLSDRHYCGLRVGHLAFPRPGVKDDRRPRIGIACDDSAAPLAITARRTDIFGSTSVAGRVVVGDAPSADPAPLLAVRPEISPRELGRITVVDGVAFGDHAQAMAALSRGDVLRAADQSLRVEGTLGRGVLSVTAQSEGKALPLKLPKTGVTAEPNIVALVRTGNLEDALCVKNNGVVGIGRVPGDHAAAGLVVGDGDIRLDQERRVLFPNGGSVAGGTDDGYGVRFADTSLEIRSAGDIAFFPGRAAPDDPPKMLATSEGKLGIGVTVVGSALTVNGTIRATGGLIFPDGTVQNQAVSDLPVGAVIDWWRPKGSGHVWSREGFQLCDGSEIVDPASPLRGQKTPNLNGCFVRGVVNTQNIGSNGGAETHTHALGAHTHDIPHRHQITGKTGVSSATAVTAEGEGTSVSAADHVHDVDAPSGDPVPGKTSPPGESPKTEAADTLPLFMELLKVMRIK